MFDRRVDDDVECEAYLFDATFDDGLTAEIQVNPEFGSEAAAQAEADKYGDVIGRLPTVLRADVETVTIHKGTRPFGGGNDNLLIHTGQSARYEADGILEETLVHEASHTSLDDAHAEAAGWLDAQRADAEFISNYARDNPIREDVAESFLPYLAIRYRADRIDGELADTLNVDDSRTHRVLRRAGVRHVSDRASAGRSQRRRDGRRGRLIWPQFSSRSASPRHSPRRAQSPGPRLPKTPVCPCWRLPIPSSPNGLAPNLSGVNLLAPAPLPRHAKLQQTLAATQAGAVTRIEAACRQAVAGKLAVRELARWVDGFGVSETEFRLLWQLFLAAESPSYRPGALFDQAELAVRLAVSPAQVSGVVERLRSLALLERDAQPGDRRRQLWRLAPAGRTLVLAVVAAVDTPASCRPGRKGSGMRRLALALTAVLAACGCSRTFYRQQADADAYCLIDPKAAVVGAAPSTYRIDIDPRSRMFDPNNPDVEPMPPDDPVSNRYMEVRRLQEGLEAVERAAARRRSSRTPTGSSTCRGTRRARCCSTCAAPSSWRCCESPDYQAELEDLYLSALDVSFERFRFDTQFFGGSRGVPHRRRQGPHRHGQLVDRVRRLAAAAGQPAAGASGSRRPAASWSSASPTR